MHAKLWRRCVESVGVTLVATCVLFLAAAAGAPQAFAMDLQNGVVVKGSTTGGNQQYTITVPPETLSLSIAVRSQKRGNHLDLFLNAPGVVVFPARGNAAYSSENYNDGGSNENIWLFNPSGLMAGEYRLLVEKVGKEGCDYEIVAQFQQSRPVALGESVVSTTNDDKVNGSKFFHCDVGEGYDFLDVAISSETKGNGLDLYVNTPAAPYYPNSKSNELASTNYNDGGNQEWVYIDPPAKVPAGRYRISVMQPGSDSCAQFKLTVFAEKIATLANKKPVKKPTRRNGEFFYFEVPEGAKKLTVATESIVKENILDLFVNAPIDETFPTTKAFRYASTNYNDRGAFEKIEVPDPEAGIYYILVKNLRQGNDYIIRASWE